MNEQAKQSLKSKGYEVLPSSTQPGKFQWRLKMLRAGVPMPAITRPASFSSEEDTWADAQSFQNERNAEIADLFDELTTRVRTLGCGDLHSAVGALERMFERAEGSEATERLAADIREHLSSALSPGVDRDNRPRGS